MFILINDKKDIEKIDVIIDSRETKEIKTYLKRYHSKKFNFNVKQIKTGDYLTDRVICERKTVKDLFGSINDGRFTGQMNRLASFNDHVKILLVIGDINKDCKDINRKIRSKKIKCNELTLIKTIASAGYRYGLEIIWAHEQKEGLRTLLAYIEGVHEGKLWEPKGAFPNVLMARYLGISTDSMMELIEKYETVKCLTDVSQSELIKIDGIGTKRAKKIKERLNNKIIVGDKK